MTAAIKMVETEAKKVIADQQTESTLRNFNSSDLSASIRANILDSTQLILTVFMPFTTSTDRAKRRSWLADNFSLLSAISFPVNSCSGMIKKIPVNPPTVPPKPVLLCKQIIFLSKMSLVIGRRSIFAKSLTN